MKPVHQTHFQPSLDGPGEPGNCIQAAICSILEVGLDETPNFVALAPDGDSWTEPASEWLQEHHGRTIVAFPLSTTDEWLDAWDKLYSGGCHYILSGKSPRGEWGHVVVRKEGKLVHDPHPDSTGIDGPFDDGNGDKPLYWVYLIVPFDRP